MQHRHDADPTATFIIGAGLSGLVAATVLDRQGYTVRIVDKGRSVGGRLATRRIGDAVLDHGAQFFTTRSDEFRAAVAEWIDAGVVEEWCKGFDGDGDGHPRYRTVGGMNQLAKHLRAGLTDSAHLLTSHRAASIIPLADNYAITYDGAVREPDEANAIIATAPVPQTLEVLDSGGVRIDQRASGVRDLSYHKVVGLLATIDRAAPFGPAGALQRPDDPVFTFCCDNSTKGISPVPAVTLHAAHDLSAELWNRPDPEILGVLRPEAERLLGDARIDQVQVKKWRYAGPVTPWPERCAVVATDPGTIVLAGDAFGGPKVEGAYLSGSAAANAVIEADRARTTTS